MTSIRRFTEAIVYIYMRVCLECKIDTRAVKYRNKKRYLQLHFTPIDDIIVKGSANEDTEGDE